LFGWIVSIRRFLARVRAFADKNNEQGAAPMDPTALDYFCAAVLAVALAWLIANWWSGK